MGLARRTWEGISHALTAHALLALLFPTGIIVGLGVYLATLTEIVRELAPLSYLVVALLLVILSLITFSLLFTVAKRAGWKPSQRETQERHVRKDAYLSEVIEYIKDVQYLNLASETLADEEAKYIVQTEIVDRFSEGRVSLWGRHGQSALHKFTLVEWPECTLDVTKLEVRRRMGAMSRMEQVFYDIRFNWREVKRAWPRENFIMRRLRKWAFKAQQKRALTPS